MAARRGDRWTRALIALVTVALVLVLIMLRGTGEEDRAATATAPAHSAPVVRGGRAPALPTEPVARDNGVVIDAITVEKDRICAGEENLVSVTAHALVETDVPELQVLIDGERGTRVAIRPQSFLDADGKTRQVKVLVGGQLRLSVDLPPFDVDDCKVARSLQVAHRVLPNAPGEFELWAKVTGDPFETVRYHWTFDDGASREVVVTAGAIVERNFRGRAQDAMYSDVLVTCEAEAADGATVVARDHITMLNPAYEQLARKGIVMLEFDHPRFPETDERGVVNWPVRVWHHQAEPVFLTTVDVLRVDRTPTGWAGNAVVPREDHVSPATILGTDTLPSSGVSAVVRLDTRAEPQVSYILFRFSGHTASGVPAYGELSVMRPTDAPTPENHVAVRDPELIARILTAQKILGRRTVTDEDLWRLEREGKLDPDKLVRPANLPTQGLDEPEPIRPVASVAH